MKCEYCGSEACEHDDDGTLLGCSDCGYDAADERDAFAKMVAASGVSNADFHAALAEFDRENTR